MGGMELNNAQLFWDDQDSATAGWTLRFRDEAGDEVTAEVDGDKDETTEALANAVTAAAPDSATGEIHVYRGDAKRGQIVLAGGLVRGWSAS